MAIDSKKSYIITELMFNLTKEEETALILVTHDQELALKCDRNLVLHDGRLEEAIR